MGVKGFAFQGLGGLGGLGLIGLAVSELPKSCIFPELTKQAGPKQSIFTSMCTGMPRLEPFHSAVTMPAVPCLPCSSDEDARLLNLRGT